MSGSGVPAGWYEDPHHIADLRWWDGSQWSEHTSAAPSAPRSDDLGAQTSAPVAASPAPSAVSVPPPNSYYSSPIPAGAAPQPGDTTPAALATSTSGRMPALVLAGVAALVVAAAAGFFVYRNVIDDSSSSTNSVAASASDATPSAGSESASNSVAEDPTASQSASDIFEAAQSGSLSNSDDQTNFLESVGWQVDDIPQVMFQPDQLHPAVVDTIQLAGDVDSMVYAGGSLWLSDGIDSISVIDTASRQVIDTIVMTSDSRLLAAVDGQVWSVGGGDGVLNVIDPASRSIVDTVSLGLDPDNMSVGFGRIWITDYSRKSVTVIDPQSHQISATIPLDVEPGEALPVGDRIWISDGSGNENEVSIVVIDPSSLTIEKTLTLAADPLIQIALEGRVFYTTWDDDNLRAIDPGSGAELASAPLGGSSFLPAIARGLLWVPVSEAGEVKVFEPSSLEEVARVPVTDPPIAAVGFGDTVLVIGEESIAMIDARSQQVVSTLVLSTFGDMVFGDGFMWVIDSGTSSVSVVDLAGG